MGAGEVRELDATVAMAAAARDMGLRGGRGDCSDDGLGGGEGAKAVLLFVGGMLGLGEAEAEDELVEEGRMTVEEGRMTVERRDGGTGGGGARFAVPVVPEVVVVIEFSMVDWIECMFWVQEKESVCVCMCV